jgi:short-subunit dehydrogenase
MKARARSIFRNAAYFGIGVAASMAVPRISSRGRRQFRGKVVVITGASRGLGLAMAEEFARRGARIVLAARDPYELDRAQRILLSKNAAKNEGDLMVVPADLRNQQEAEGLIQQATGRFGRVDVLVNNAGVITVGPIENQTVEQFHDVMESNFFSALHCTLAVLPQMLERRDGAIANITSIGGKIAVPHLLPYTASKFAAVGFSEGLGVELRSKGIRVTTVVPGLMRTGSHQNAQFTGNARAEYRWFSLAASLPAISIAAQRAARRIADAVATGTEELTITPYAFIASRMVSAVPGLFRVLLRGTQLLLPEPQQGESRPARGKEVKDLELAPLTALGSRAAGRFNQT